MSSYHQTHATIRLALGTVVLALALRTWLLMGLIVPVTVSGSSMAPTLVGPHYAARCPQCKEPIRVSIDFPPVTHLLECPYCGDASAGDAETEIQQGTRLWIDRTAYQWRKPRRWEVVVFRCPNNAERLCTKRVIGLPGEQIELAHGDVVINGQVQVKSLAEQRTLRVLLKRRRGFFLGSDRFSSLATNPTALGASRGVCKNKANYPTTPRLAPGAIGNLVHQPSVMSVFASDGPFTDNYVFNAGLSRRLNPVCDFMLSANVTCQGNGQLLLEVNDGGRSHLMLICPSSGTLQLFQHGKQIVSKKLSHSSQRQLAENEVLLEVSTFDRQLLLAIDGHVELQLALAHGPKKTAETTPPQPFAIGTNDLKVTLRQPTLWRDIYYESSVNKPSRGRPTWHLAADELFLLGDNVPVSADSRIWAHAGVPLRLLVGRPVGVR